MDRYHRQILLPQIGEQGQRTLAQASVLLIGCGALGTVIADQLVRAGIGHLTIVDRDIVELTNLQRQILFNEDDVHQGLPKAIAAHQRLTKINSQVKIDPHVLDLHPGNIEKLASTSSSAIKVNLIIDATDNVETRYLINDYSIKHNVPWIYGACVGTEGRAMLIRPNQGPCLRCLFPTPPQKGELPTCDTAGVLGPAAAIVASLQSTLALKLLLNNRDEPDVLFTLDIWKARFHTIPLADARRDDCPCCAHHEFKFLNAPHQSQAAHLCGRNAVQIPPTGAPSAMNQIAPRLAVAGTLQSTPYFLRCALHDPAGITLTLFPDGRLIVHGTADLTRAKSLAARFIGA